MEPILHSNYFTELFGEDFVHALKCSICLDYFEKPVVLICGHTFCQHCIQKTANHVLCHNTHLLPCHVSMNCPQCRRVFNAAKIAKCEKLIPTNYALKALLSHLQATKIPLKQETSTSTDAFDDYQVEIATQTSAPPEPEVTYEYDVNKLDEIERNIKSLSLTKNEPIFKSKPFTSLFTSSEFVSSMCYGSKTDKSAKISKYLNFNTRGALCNSDAKINSDSKMIASSPRKKQNTALTIEELRIDPEVSSYLSKLSK